METPGFPFAPSSGSPQGGRCSLPGYTVTRSNSLAFLESHPVALINSFSAPIGTVVFLVCNFTSWLIYRLREQNIRSRSRPCTSRGSISKDSEHLLSTYSVPRTVLRTCSYLISPHNNTELLCSLYKSGNQGA